MAGRKPDPEAFVHATHLPIQSCTLHGTLCGLRLAWLGFAFYHHAVGSCHVSDAMGW